MKLDSVPADLNGDCGMQCANLTTEMKRDHGGGCEGDDGPGPEDGDQQKPSHAHVLETGGHGYGVAHGVRDGAGWVGGW